MKSRDSLPLNQKYKYYQYSVQGTELDINNYTTIYQEVFHTLPLRLREDFSGTFLFSCDWVKSSAKRSATAIDIDEEPLNYGIKHNLSTLTPEQQTRISLLCTDVRTVTPDNPHIIAVSNFSFNVFQKKSDLKDYFNFAYQSLDKKGIIFLDMIGGSGFTKAPNCEERRYTKKDNKGHEKPYFTYYWTTHRYNSKTKDGLWSIDLKPHGAKRINNVFTYDWHLWNLREVSDLLKQTGFSQVLVYQLDTDDNEYKLCTTHPQDYCWICLVGGIKR